MTLRSEIVSFFSIVLVKPLVYQGLLQLNILLAPSKNTCVVRLSYAACSSQNCVTINESEFDIHFDKNHLRFKTLLSIPITSIKIRHFNSSASSICIYYQWFLSNELPSISQTPLISFDWFRNIFYSEKRL